MLSQSMQASHKRDWRLTNRQTNWHLQSLDVITNPTWRMADYI